VARGPRFGIQLPRTGYDVEEESLDNEVGSKSLLKFFSFFELDVHEKMKSVIHVALQEALSPLLGA